eukprot:1808888-Rhodomonas_salina.1
MRRQSGWGESSERQGSWAQAGGEGAATQEHAPLCRGCERSAHAPRTWFTAHTTPTLPCLHKAPSIPSLPSIQ